MGALNRLAELFGKFPGIGPRQAKRFVYFLLQSPPAVRKDIAGLITELGRHVHQCEACYRFYAVDGTLAKRCVICSNEQREQNSLMVVEKDVDIDAIERSGSYKGLYFVLGGVMPVLESKKGLARTTELARAVETRKPKEIILALSLTTDGEHTTDALKESLAPLVQKLGAKISTLGRGLSTGSELEYADPETIKQALGNRREA